jgi:hypothetical protein
MGQVVRHEFLGSRLYVFLLCLTVIGIPLAILYAKECTVTIVEEMENPSDFLETWKGKGVWGDLWSAWTNRPW